MAFRFPQRAVSRGENPSSGGAATLDPPAVLDPSPAPGEPLTLSENGAQAGTPGGEEAAKPAKPPRLVSLDAFRGLTIIGMLLVNNVSLGGQTPAQLMHAEWSGRVNLADLVFPWFLFIVGVAVPYAAASARRKHLPVWQYDMRALYRAAALVGLGCLIDSFLNHRLTFDLGVLQLIGLAYFVAVLIGGLFPLTGRLVMAGILLVASWAILKFVPLPGVGAGVFTETSNVFGYVNKTYLAQYHLNGLLSVIPTTALVLIGTAVGDLLRRKKISSWKKLAVLEVCGAGLIAAGLLWADKLLLGGYALPMNKPLWTAPYILYAGGMGCVVLGIMYAIVDMTPGKLGAKAAFPLLVFGMNAIVAYVAPILIKVAILRNISTSWPTGKVMNMEEALHQYAYLVAGHGDAVAGRIPGGWLYTIGYIAFYWCILLVLHRKRWFLRV